VGTTRDLAVLDAEGHERARVTLPEPAFAPLVSALGKVVAVTSSGAVWAWTPGAAEAERVASFGAPVEDGAALVDDHTLAAVTSGRARVATVDLVRGTTATRAAVSSGIWLGPPAVHAGTTYVLLLGATSELAVALDPSGAEVLRAPLFTFVPPAPPDGGTAAPLAPGPRTPPLVDAAGTLAFATPAGDVGVLEAARTASGLPGAVTVELLSDACPSGTGRSAGGTAAAGLAPLADGALVVACTSGTLLAVHGTGGGGPTAPHL
jgi:hypothetical protein